MTTPLLPPEGAEPGSAWLIYHEADRTYVWAVCWTDGQWDSVSPEEMGESGYHLSDPHGAAAAVAVLEGWIAKQPDPDAHYQICGETDGCVVILYVGFSEHDEPFPPSGEHPTSFLAAALAAVRDWEGRDG